MTHVCFQSEFLFTWGTFSITNFVAVTYRHSVIYLLQSETITVLHLSKRKMRLAQSRFWVLQKGRRNFQKYKMCLLERFPSQRTLNPNLQMFILLTEGIMSCAISSHGRLCLDYKLFRVLEGFCDELWLPLKNAWLCAFEIFTKLWYF